MFVLILNINDYIIMLIQDQTAVVNVGY